MCLNLEKICNKRKMNMKEILKSWLCDWQLESLDAVNKTRSERILQIPVIWLGPGPGPGPGPKKRVGPSTIPAPLVPLCGGACCLLPQERR